MNDIHIAGTRQTPAVDFVFSAHKLSLVGEAYPENAAAFFEPLNAALAEYLAATSDQPLTVMFDLRYLNSASTKMIFRLVGLLDAAAQQHRKVRLEFRLLEDDDMLLEFGNELKEDHSWIDFEFVTVA